MNAINKLNLSPVEIKPLAPIGGVIHDRWLAWDLHRSDFLRALEECHGTHTEDDVLLRLGTGEYFIWGNDGAATVGFFVQYPRMRGLNMFIAGGNLEALLAMQPGIELWAKSQGVARMVGGGRTGWRRKFHDYQDGGVLMYKDL